MMGEKFPRSEEVLVDLTPVLDSTGAHIAVEVARQVVLQNWKIANEPSDVVSLCIILILSVSLKSSAVALEKVDVSWAIDGKQLILKGSDKIF